MTAAPRVLALATLLAVGAQTLSNGGADGRHASAGVERYTKLDRFLQDRMGLAGVFGGGVGNRSGPSAPTTDRGLLSRTAAASAAVPEDEDDDGADNEDDGDDDDDDEEDDEEDLQDEKYEATPEPIVRLRHKNAAAAAAAVKAEKDLNVYGKVIIIIQFLISNYYFIARGYRTMDVCIVSYTRQNYTYTVYGLKRR